MAAIGLETAAAKIEASLRERFGAEFEVPANLPGAEALAHIASRRVHRRYSGRAVDAAIVRLLCACALSSASKSDLQQRDIVVITDPAIRAAIADLIPATPAVRAAPLFLVFCANGARVREVAALRDKPFPNNHLDLFFNAVGDAAIALATFMNAAEAIGLGCCPISEIRNHVKAIDALLELPDQVIPYAGMCLGWPAAEGQISPRLPLEATVHENRYRSAGLAQSLDAYDRRRESLQPYEHQLQPDRWGVAAQYGWSEQKARQYSVAQRTDFGAYVRAKGFVLD
jgi:nitroreductase